MISEEELRGLLDDIIEIIVSPSLPTLNNEKTIMFCTWTLSIMQLPDICVAPRKHELKLVFKTALEMKCPEIIAHDALQVSFPAVSSTSADPASRCKAVTRLLLQNASAFTMPFSELFPLVLDRLLVSDVSMRTQVGNVFCGYASAFLRLLSSRSKLSVRQNLHTFIDSQMARKSELQDYASGLHLQDVLSCTVNSQDISAAGHHLIWVLCVLAACVVILDGEIFIRPRCLKLILTASAPAATHRSLGVRSIHTLLWRCLIWAFGRLGQVCDLEKIAAASNKDPEDLKGRAFRLVGQELVRGNGTALLAVLSPPLEPWSSSAGNSDQHDTKRAIDTIKEMMNHRERSTRVEGLAAFAKLLDTNKSSVIRPSQSLSLAQRRETQLIPPDLFNGTLLQLEAENLSDTLASLVQFDIEQIGPLSERAIIHNWNELLDIWVCCARSALEDGESAFSQSVRSVPYTVSVS